MPGQGVNCTPCPGTGIQNIRNQQIAMVLRTAQYIKHIKIHEALRLACVQTGNGAVQPVNRTTVTPNLCMIKHNTDRKADRGCNFTISRELKQKKNKTCHDTHFNSILKRLDLDILGIKGF